MVNIRTKGQSGEREIADDLNLAVWKVYKKLGVPYPEKELVQRNQNQSAVGGSDLTGTFGLCIEIKRQETLSINSWWAQCIKASEEFGGLPVLLFRQSAKQGQRIKWRCILQTELTLPTGGQSQGCTMQVRAEIDYAVFLEYFEQLVFRSMQSSVKPTTTTLTPTVLQPGLYD